MTTPIVFLTGRMLVWDTGMYRFDLNRWPIVQRIGRRFRSNLYILVYHTNGRPIKNTIGVVMNRLVGMGLYLFIIFVIKTKLNFCSSKSYNWPITIHDS